MDYYALMQLVSELGTKLASAGAETYRVEESIRRVVAAYGLQAKVYAVPNSLIITILVPGQFPITKLCRIEHHSTDMEGIERYSNLSRKICTETPELKIALSWLDNTAQQRKSYSLPCVLLGNIMVASGFCIFFGGTFTDSFCAALCGLVIGLIAYLFEKVNTNLFFHKITAAFFMALCPYLLNALHLVHEIDAVIAGSLMLLVPGLLFTNAMRDIIYGDTNSGINRMVEVLLIAAAIALGVAAAWHTAVTVLPPQPFSPALTHSPTITILASFLACSGFVLVFNVHGWGKVLCALGGAITWAAYCLADYAGGSSVLCFFIATIVATIFSEIMARIRKYPATSYLVISLLPLIPGAGIYYAAHQAVQSNLSGFLSYSTSTLSTAGALAVGILVVTSVIRLWHDRTIGLSRPTKIEK